MRRLSIRVRLTLAFALAMALVLASIGLVVHERLGSTLLGSVDQSLRVQASEAAARFQRARTLFDPDAVRGTSAGQVIAADGAVVLSYPRRLPPLVPAAARLQVLRRGRPVLRSADVAGLADEWRLLAVPLRHGRTRAVLIVGASLAERNKSLSNLAGELLLAGPAGLLLAVIGGYILAAAALRPVEAMRRRAEVITASTPGCFRLSARSDVQCGILNLFATSSVPAGLPPASVTTSIPGIFATASRCLIPKAPCPATAIFMMLVS